MFEVPEYFDAVVDNFDNIFNPKTIVLQNPF
jgi:hypothetical protein